MSRAAVVVVLTEHGYLTGRLLAAGPDGSAVVLVAGRVFPVEARQHLKLTRYVGAELAAIARAAAWRTPTAAERPRA
ncbi:MAG: hypothetical protein IT370_09365 [Deltaproteobacteria bacterium]|nr:hypothetical protein [Deltaproteobacteria bacterium]